MKTLETNTGPGFLRQPDMEELVASERDPITQHLMMMAAQVVFARLVRRENGPRADFDLGYFMEVIREFVSDHETLRKILVGKGDELIWLAEE